MSFDIKKIIGLSTGFIAYTILYLGKGIQKYAVEGFKDQGKVNVKDKNTGIWIIGTILTSIYMFIQWAALFLAPINLIAPIEAIGLIVLVIFSFYILKEDISKLQIIGIGLIIIGTILITLFNVNSSEVGFNDFQIELFLIFSLTIIFIEFIAILISKLNNSKMTGLILGITAGTFMAFQTVTKRITAIPNAILSLTFTIITFLFAILTLIMTQYAFTRAKANVVVPCFTSASIIIAVLISYITLNEIIVVSQIVGFVIIVFGIIFLTAFTSETKK